MGFLSNLFGKGEPWMKDNKFQIFVDAQNIITNQEVGRYAECFRRAKYLQEQGYPGASTLVGACYHHGFGTAVNYEEAMRNYSMGTGEDDSNAMYIGVGYAYHNMAQMHETGVGAPLDIAKAIVYYERAIDNEFPLSAFRMGDLYLEGKGVPQDTGKALEWYKKYPMAWSYRSLVCIADMYAEGKGVRQDLEMAKNMYGRAVVLSFGRNQEAKEKFENLKL